MNPLATQLQQIPLLLRGDTGRIGGWLQRCEPARAGSWVLALVIGTALGSWRAPEQALYTAIKLPLVALLTSLLLVMLQMTTALRPIVGTASTLLPTEKKFFFVHWIDNLEQDHRHPAKAR